MPKTTRSKTSTSEGIYIVVIVYHYIIILAYFNLRYFCSNWYATRSKTSGGIHCCDYIKLYFVIFN